MGSLAVLLSVLAVVRAQQAGMCQQRYTTCD
eukprot:COSAG01_NODE_57170_length_314_cov_0.632558_1_plen_30_part_01